MNKKKAGIILGAVAVAAAAAVGIWYFFGDGGRDSKDRVYVEKVSTIMGNTMGAQNRYSGVVQPQETVEINADSERTVSEVLVEVGDAVEVGTPLFNYDTEDLNLELEQAKLELENQDIEISNYRSQITELEKERTAAAEANKFEYTTQIQTIQTQIKQAEFTKSSKQLEMDKIQKKVDNSQVLSTASGVIKSINNGQSQDEESSAFMTILSVGEYRIKGLVNEQNAGMISSGLDVIVRSRVDESITWEGTIDSLDTGEGPDNSSNQDMYMDYDDNEGSSSSNYAFYVTMLDADGLMLGQHVLIELDEGQMEEKEGIWIYSGYIAFEGQEGNMAGGMGDSLNSLDSWDDTEMPLDYDDSMDTEMLMGSFDSMDMEDISDDSDDYDSYDYDSDDYDSDDYDSDDYDSDDYDSDDYDYDDYDYDEEDTELWSDTEMPSENGMSGAYVWADNGNGRLEKRSVELGEYDEELDQYEILSGLTEDDLIAWPMPGLYEGVRTVTDMEEVDYTSDLYNQEMGTEDLWFDTESGGEYDNLDDGFYDMEDYDDSYDNSDDLDEDYDDSYDDYDDDDSDDNISNDTEDGLTDKSDKKTLDLDDFLRMEGIQ